MPLFGQPNVEKMERKRDVQGLVKALESTKDAGVRAAAAGALGRAGDTRALAPLVAALGDAYREVRAAAAGALGALRDARAVGPLLAILVERDTERTPAAPTDGLTMEQVLARLTTQATEVVRPAVVAALGSIGAPAVPALAASLAHREAVVRKAAAQALARAGWQPDRGETGAAYWAEQGAWEECVAIGAPALRALTAILLTGYLADRAPAADALGRIGDARALAPLTAALHDSSASQAAAGALARLGEPAVEPLLAALSSSSWTLRAAVARALGQVGDSRAAGPLAERLGDEVEVREAAAGALVELGAPGIGALRAALGRQSALVRRAAAEALDRSGWQPGSGELAVAFWAARGEWERCAALGAGALKPLTALLADPAGDVRMGAAGALAAIGDARAAEPLVAALQAAGYEPAVREALSAALVRMGAPAAPPLVALLGDQKDPGASAILAKIGAPAVEPLVALLRDTQGEVRRREAAAALLGALGDARAVEPLVSALQDELPWVAKAACAALGASGDGRAAGPLARALLSPSPEVRRAAAGGLEKLGWQPAGDEDGAAYWAAREEWDRCVALGAPAVGALIVALQHGFCKKEPVQALGRLGDPRAAEPLVAALPWLEPEARQAAVEALAQIGAPAIEPLIVGLSDSHAQARRSSAEALGRIRDGRAAEPLIAALSDPEWGVREAAAGALDRLGWAPGADAAAAAYWTAKKQWDRCAAIGEPAVERLIADLRFQDAAVRSAAAGALGRIGDVRAVEPLIGALSDAEWGVRQAAAAVLVSMHSSARLDSRQKQSVLEQRSAITQSHVQKRWHEDVPGQSSDCPSPHQDVDRHEDLGIGVAFPV